MDSAGAGRLDPDLLHGVVKGAEGATTIKIANPERLLRGQFERIGVSALPPAAGALPAAAARATTAAPQRQTSLVSFDLGTGVSPSARSRA